jgi:hypothetical protein
MKKGTAKKIGDKKYLIEVDFTKAEELEKGIRDFVKLLERDFSQMMKIKKVKK